MFGVNTFSVEYGDEATADFVAAAGLLFFTKASNLGLRLQTSRSLTMMSLLVIGTWIQATNA
jgi:hypothetical protein